LRKIPGNIITSFNQKEQTTFSVFLHAPFKEQLYDEEKTKNSASIVFQARFKQSAADSTFSCLAMFGGDADHYSWCIIREKTEANKNQSALAWDLFLAPHHCSWTYFNDCPQKDNPTPKESSLAILNYKRQNARVIASSKAIHDNDDNPPHYQAKQQYVSKVGSDKFLNTETHKLKGKTPQPIVFEVTAQGPVPPKASEGTAKGAGAAGLGVVNAVSGYGAF